MTFAAMTVAWAYTGPLWMDIHAADETPTTILETPPYTGF